MLLGARQECIAGGADIQEKMAILKSFGYDFLELSLSRTEIANLGSQSADSYKAAAEQSGLAIRSTSLGHFGGFAALPADERAVIIQHIRAFVDQMSAAAQAASNRSGVPAKLILSQAALESGWGQREILRPDGTTTHNLFGIKAGGNWHGEVVNVMTTEYDDKGVPHKVEQPFRAYKTYADSFADYASLIGNSGRYSEVTTAPSAEEAARRIQTAGYATDPSYADKLISIMGYFQAR